MTRPRLIYVAGVPGVGKSTAVNGYLARFDAEAVRAPVPHVLYWHPSGDPVLAQLGAPHDVYPGTDRLNYSVAAAASEWVRGFRLDVIAEGDRLATRKFLGPLTPYRDVFLVHAFARPETVEARRAARGSAQNETWLRGRATKVERLVAWARATLGAHVVDLDLDAPVEAQFDVFRGLVG